MNECFNDPLLLLLFCILFCDFYSLAIVLLRHQQTMPLFAFWPFPLDSVEEVAAAMIDPAAVVACKWRFGCTVCASRTGETILFYYFI